MRFDLHVHTTAGSADSSFKVSELGEAARRKGVDGVLISEHFRQWTDYEVQSAQDEHGVIIIAGREWNTHLGHILSIGLPTPVGPFDDVYELRAAATKAGALLIAAHPFRYLLNQPSSSPDITDCEWRDVERVAQLPIFGLVDGIEVRNGHCTANENELAQDVATFLDLAVTAGSDAHHADELGNQVLKLSGSIRDAHDLVGAIVERPRSRTETARPEAR